ncbi:hypothetical protein B0J18DRAFT_414260 [Chaetomium sp. MPI-SDFR-AT-0129]|nr:hypothetical protein B0J18DRAFT_414260 [Chaetomium sp. MPI-SDFR-AT-0129]
MNYISRLPPELQTMIVEELPLKANRWALLKAYPDLAPAINRARYLHGMKAEYDLMVHLRILLENRTRLLANREEFLRFKHARLADVMLTADGRFESRPCCAAGIEAFWDNDGMGVGFDYFEHFSIGLACDIHFDGDKARAQGQQPQRVRMHMLEARQYEPKSLKCPNHSPSEALLAQVYRRPMRFHLSDGLGSTWVWDEFWFVDGSAYKFMPATQLLPLVRYLDALRLCVLRFHADVRWNREYLYGWQAEILALLGCLPIYLDHRQINANLSRPSLRDERVAPRSHTNLPVASFLNDYGDHNWYKNDYGTAIPLGSATHALRTLSAFRYLTILYLTGGVTVQTDLFTAQVVLVDEEWVEYPEACWERAMMRDRVLDGSVPMLPETEAFPALRVFVLGFAAETGGGGWFFVADRERDEEEPAEGGSDGEKDESPKPKGGDDLGGDAVAEGKEGDNSEKPIGELDGADEKKKNRDEEGEDEKMEEDGEGDERKAPKARWAYRTLQRRPPWTPSPLHYPDITDEEDDDDEPLDVAALPASEREALAQLEPEPVYRFRTRPNGRTVNKFMLGAAQAVDACMPRIEHFELKLEDNFDEDGDGVAPFVEGSGPRKRKLKVVYDAEAKVVTWELGYYARTWRPAAEVVEAWEMVGEDVQVVFRE